MRIKLLVSGCMVCLLVLLLSMGVDSRKPPTPLETETPKSEQKISESKERATHDPYSFKAPGAPEAVKEEDSRQPSCPWTGNRRGPWNYGDWIADMAFNPITQYVYQVEVGGGNGVFEWDPPNNLLISYCPDPGWVVSQRGIAYDPLCNLMYVGGWNQDIIYAVTPPPNCQIKYQYPSPIAGVSGLAYDDSCEVLYIISNSAPDWLCSVDPANGNLITGPWPVQWKCPQMYPDTGQYQAAGLAFTKWIYWWDPPPDYCPGLFAPNQLDAGAPSNYSEILNQWGVSHGCCQLDPVGTTHGWGVETFDVPGTECHWLSQVNPSTWMDNCHYRPELQEPIPWECEPFQLAPRNLECEPTDTCCLLTWVNPIPYDNIIIYRSWGPIIEPIDTIPGDMETYWDSTCTCTGNWDFYVTGVTGGQESAPSNLCICVKFGQIQYFWDFNESDGGFNHYPVMGGVDDWQYGPAPFYRPDTLYPQALTCWECGDSLNDPVPLDSCWGTMLNGPYSILACCKLVSPWIEIDSCSGLLQICHWHEFERELWDGGNIKLHVWPDSEYQYLIYPCYEIPLGYQGPISTGYENCLEGQDAFANYSYALPGLPNTRPNGWRISYFDLRAWLDGMGFTGRQTIQFAFHFGSDNYSTEDWGWYIKWAKIFHCECEQPPPPEDLGCTSTDTCIILNWTNPVDYDSIKVYRSHGGLEPLPLIVLPGSPTTYHDTSCCCTGNYDYHVTGFTCGSESDPSNTCWVYKLGMVHYFWDFNESDQGWMWEENYPGVNSWQWGFAAPPHYPGEPTCDSCGVGPPVPLTNYWGTIIGGAYLPNSCCRLYSPPVELDSCALLQICHWYDFTYLDGGNLKVRPVGGDWELITPCLGYPFVLDTYCHKIEGMPGYSGASGGWVLDYFDLSALGYGGQTIEIAFDFGSDEFEVNWGWYIKWAKIYHCECEPPPPPENLGCTSTDTCIVLNWTNPVQYDSIAVFKSWGGLPATLLEVLPNSPTTYHDTSCCCTGNYDYHLIGYRCGEESGPSETCWVYKLGKVQYFWDFNEPVETFVRGDVDEDGDVDMADVLRCYQGPPFSCDDAADVNDDGVLDTLDCDYLSEYIYVPGSPEPPPPFPGCGIDPTSDGLGCADFPPCPIPQEWMWEENPPGVNSWQWGFAALPHYPGEPTCDSCGVGPPVPLTNYWGTIIGGPYLPNSCCRLYSPPVELDSCALLQICHWYDFTYLDGGNLKVSVDGGPWELITPCLGYPFVLDTYCHKIEGMPGYSGSSGGWVLDYFDLAALGYANRTIQIAFDFGSDEFEVNWGWYIKWVKIYYCEPPDTGTFIRGDVDGNGLLSLGDGLRCFRCQFVPGWQDSCRCDDATDADDNGVITIGDCLRILRKQFVPGWQDSIPPPCCDYPDSCGPDPTPDALDCSTHICQTGGKIAPKPRIIGGELIPGATTVEDRRVILPVHLSANRELSGFAYTISYNPSVLRFVSLEVEGLVTETFDFISALPEHGHVKVGAVVSFDFTHHLPKGKYHVADLVFEAERLDSDIWLKFEDAELVDVNVKSLTATLSDAVVRGLKRPTIFRLGQNYPNPVRTSGTLILYQIPKSTHTTLTIYNQAGQLVKTLVDRVDNPGYYSVLWDGCDARGERVASGVYFYRLRAGSFVDTKKLTMVR